MYMDDTPLTPRDRIDNNMLRRMLDSCDDRMTEPEPLAERRAPEGRRSWALTDHPLAMVYAPYQEFRNLYDKETALKKGTIFSELDFPFLGESVMKGESCRD